MEPALSLKPVGVSTPDSTTVRDPASIHLDADVQDEDGWDLFDAFYIAQLDAQCTGGGRALLDEASYDWDVAAVDGGFNLTVSVSIPVECPGVAEHPPIEAHEQREVRYRSERCHINVLIERAPLDEISHVDVEIVCGSYRELFGYFPGGASPTLFSTITGVDGTVKRAGIKAGQNPGGWTDELIDKVGQDYDQSHTGKKLEVYRIEPAECSTCISLRNVWERLAANPGTYGLLSNNCATNAFGALTASGALPPLPGFGTPFAPSQLGLRLRAMAALPSFGGTSISGPEHIR
jgi:hypothetical protein